MKKANSIDDAMSTFRRNAEMRAAGATCPMPGCGALAISYEAADSLNEMCRPLTASWDFICSECGAEFMAAKSDLLFQAIPRDWLFSQVCRA